MQSSQTSFKWTSLFFFQLLTMSLQWHKLWWRDSNWLPRGCESPCQQAREPVLSPIGNRCPCQLQPPVVSVKKGNELTNVKIKTNKSNRELFRWFVSSSSVLMEPFPQGKEGNDNFFLSPSFTFLVLLSQVVWMSCLHVAGVERGC